MNDPRPVVLITGGGTGIGAAVARRLATTHRVVVCGRRADAIERIANEIAGTAIVADVSVESSVAQLCDRVSSQFGRLDGLVLNAGILRPAPVAQMTTDDWRAHIDTNLTGPFWLLRGCLPLLLQSRGSIVSVSSISALQAGQGMAAYSASKAGLNLLTQSVAFEYGRHGVRANVVCPGWTRTAMNESEAVTAGGGDVNAGYKIFTRFVPQRRQGESSEAAEAVVWLLSPAASYVNGAVLNVDGGATTVCAALSEFDPP